MNGTASGFAELKKGRVLTVDGGLEISVKDRPEPRARGGGVCVAAGAATGAARSSMWPAGQATSRFRRREPEQTLAGSTLRPISSCRPEKGRNQKGLKIRFIEADAEQLPAAAAQFDVVCSHVWSDFAAEAGTGGFRARCEFVGRAA